MQSTDFTRLPSTLLLTFTDFAAVMTLHAFQTLNSNIDIHAINDNAVVAYNQQIVEVGEDKEKVETLHIDVHHFLAETI